VAEPGLGRRIQTVGTDGPAPQDSLDDLRERPGLSRLHARPYRRDAEKSGAQGTWLFNPGARELSRTKVTAVRCGEPFALRFRVPPTGQLVRFADAVYWRASKGCADIEDFALLRSDGIRLHLASCADDSDLRISHIIRGQDHLSNTYKHILIFEAAGCKPPQFAHLRCWSRPMHQAFQAPHGPVVSVTTYRDAGFLSEAFINFLCLSAGRPRTTGEYVPAGTNRYFLARRHQPLECSGELQGGECGAGALARRQFAISPDVIPNPPRVVIPPSPTLSSRAKRGILV